MKQMAGNEGILHCKRCHLQYFMTSKWDLYVPALEQLALRLKQANE